MKRMLSMLALLGTFLLMPLVAQAQQKYTITFTQVEHATIKADYFDSLSGSIVDVKSGDQVPRMVSLNIMAKPEVGFMVTHYIVNGEERESNGGSIRLTVSENLIISARVAPATLHTVTITQPEHGTLKVKDGATEVPSGDKKYFGTRLSLELTPETGYENEYWIINGKKYSPSKKAGAANKATLTVREDVTVTAQLKVAGTKTMASVTLVKPEHATVKAYKGKYASSSPELAAGEQVEAGSEILVVVTPEAGYGVDYWLFNSQRVEKATYRPNQQTFKILEASTIEPVLKEAGYKITYEQPAEGGTLSVKTGYGASAKPVPSGSRVKERESLTIEATVEAGYLFKHFLINGKVKTVTNPRFPYTYEYANSDMTIAAVIEKVKPCIVTITPFEHGTLTVTNASTSADIKNGEEVAANTSIRIEAKVNPDYEFKHFLINGVETPHTRYSDYFKTYSYSYTATGPVTIAVVAEKKPTTVITIDPFEHGELVVKYGQYPNSIEVKSGDAVPQGAKISVDAFFDDGYGLDHFLVNGEPKPSESNDPESDYIVLTVGATPLKLSAVAKSTQAKVTMVQPDATQGTMTAHYTNDATKAVTDGMSVEKDTQVTFVVVPAEGYEMDSWKVNDETKELDASKPNELTLPVRADLKVEPVLKEKAAPQPTEYTVTMIQPKEGQGTMTAFYYNATGDKTALTTGNSVPKGSYVTFEVTPAEGYEMDHWMIDDQLVEGTSNTKGVTVEANLKVEPILKKVGGSAQPTEGKITIIQPKTEEGSMRAYTFDDEGEELPIQDGQSVKIGTAITFVVTPKEGYEMASWKVNDETRDLDASEPNKLKLTVNGNLKVEPVLKEAELTEGKITLVQPKKDAQGKETGTLAASYEDEDYGQTVLVKDGDMVDIDTKVTFAVTPAEGYEIDHWMVNDKQTDPEQSNPNIINITVTGDLKVEPILKKKAPVNPTKGTLTITREGTGATISGKYVTPDEMTFSIWEGNTKQVPLGSKVTLTADLTAGFEVTYLNNGTPAPAEALSEEGKVYTFTVQGDVTVVAKVTEKQVTGEFTVTCIADPEEGGKVSASTAEGPITNETKVAAGTFITVTATPNDDFEVDQWFLGDEEIKNKKGQASYTFALTEDVTVKVTFKSTLPPAEYAVTVEPVLPSAEAGEVHLFQKNGVPFESGKSVVEGTEMYVEVMPADKYELEMLQVGETKIPAGDEKLVNIAGGGVKYTFTVTAATKVQATFKLANAVEQLAQSDVAVYVTNGGTRLEIAGAAEGAEVRLYDYTGQLLLTSTEHALDISALPAGSYIVLVGNYTTRIVK